MKDPVTIPITENEQEAMIGMATDTCEDFGYLPFKAIAARCELHPGLIRRTVRALARKGLAQYARGLWSDDGMPGGAGYALTPVGRKRAYALIDEREKR